MEQPSLKAFLAANKSKLLTATLAAKKLGKRELTTTQKKNVDSERKDGSVLQPEKRRKIAKGSDTELAPGSLVELLKNENDCRPSSNPIQQVLGGHEKDMKEVEPTALEDTNPFVEHAPEPRLEESSERFPGNTHRKEIVKKRDREDDDIQTPKRQVAVSFPGSRSRSSSPVPLRFSRSSAAPPPTPSVSPGPKTLQAPKLASPANALRQSLSSWSLWNIPKSYKALAEAFYALDNAVTFLMKSGTAEGSLVDFYKIKKPVENQTSRSFELSHVAQIRTIFPEAYQYRPSKTVYKGETVFSVLLMLSISPGEREILDSVKKTSPIRTPPNPIAVLGWRLANRKDEFMRRLVGRVQNFHEEFLKENGIGEMQRESKSWHKDFDVDSIPEVPRAELPLMEVVPMHQNRDLVLREVEPPKASKVQANGSENNEEQRAARTETSRGKALLERIRAKERIRAEAAAAASIAGSEDEIKNREKLPQVARSLLFLFVSVGKKTMELQQVLGKLVDSCSVATGRDEMEKLVSHIATKVPNWCKIASVGRARFVKLDDKTPLSDVLATLS